MVMICIVRIIYKKRERVSIISLLYVYILCVVFVSIIGAVISTYAFNKFDYPDYNSLRYMTMVFTRQQIPLIVSSFLSRLPVNALDKLIAVFAGYGLYLLIDRVVSIHLLRRHSTTVVIFSQAASESKICLTTSSSRSLVFVRL
jgi:hypothetical protein